MLFIRWQSIITCWVDGVEASLMIFIALDYVWWHKRTLHFIVKPCTMKPDTSLPPLAPAQLGKAVGVRGWIALVYYAMVRNSPWLSLVLILKLSCSLGVSSHSHLICSVWSLLLFQSTHNFAMQLWVVIYAGILWHCKEYFFRQTILL